jgi:hypothetical protein
MENIESNKLEEPILERAIGNFFVSSTISELKRGDIFRLRYITHEPKRWFYCRAYTNAMQATEEKIKIFRLNKRTKLGQWVVVYEVI